MTNSLKRSSRILFILDKNMTILTVLSLSMMAILVLLLPVMVVVSADDDLMSNNNNNYEWKDWNYYEILGLSPSPPSTTKVSSDGHTTTTTTAIKKPLSRRKRMSQRNKITTKDIKKAYRREAQLWHPDKWASRLSSSRKNHTNGSNDNNNNNNNNNKNNYPTTMEECTERFARIAQAYEVLTNDFNRMEYDLNLLDMEDEQQAQSNNNNYNNNNNNSYKKPSFVEKFANKDPRKIFEDFFFGEDSLFTKNNGVFQSLQDLFNDFGDDRNNNEQQQQQQKRQKQQYSEPYRVTESTQIRYDSRLGRDIHRILHREEYHYSESEAYFRIIAQEFIQEESYHYQQGPSEFVPITDPYILEDGFVPILYSQQTDDNTKQKQQQQRSSMERQPLSHESSILDFNEYITPESRYFLRSPNKQYYAGLTPNCELIVMLDKSVYKQRNHNNNNNNNEEEYEDDKLIWTSNSYVPPSFTNHHDSQCYLAIYNSQLAVVIGSDVDDPLSVLWNSPQPKNIYNNIKHLFQNRHHNNNPNASSSSSSQQQQQQHKLEYYLSLDNDGSLTLYRVRTTSSTSSSFTKTTLTEKLSSWWALFHTNTNTNTNKEYKNNNKSDNDDDDYSNMKTKTTTTTTTTHAAAAWKSVQSWAIQKMNRFHYLNSSMRGRNEEQSPPNNNNNKEYDETNNNNNNSYGSSSSSNNNKKDECIFSTSLVGCFTPGRQVLYMGKSAKRSLDNHLDGFVEMLQAEDDDEDVLDTLTRVVGKVGDAVGKASIRMAKKSVRDIRVASHIVSDLIREQIRFLRKSIHAIDN